MVFQYRPIHYTQQENTYTGTSEIARSLSWRTSKSQVHL